MSRLERLWHMLPANVRTYIRDLVERLEPPAPHCERSPYECAQRDTSLDFALEERDHYRDSCIRHIERVRQLEADRDVDVEKMGKLLGRVHIAQRSVMDLNAFYTDMAARRREDNSERMLGPCDDNPGGG